MNKSISRGVLLLASCMSASAWAGGDSGFYVGGSVGQSAVDVKFNNASLDDNNTGYKIIGGYNFGIVPLIDLAVEADYRDFGTFEDKQSGIKSGITAFDFFALGGFNFGPVGLFGKVGYCSGEIDGLEKQQDFKSSDSYSAFGLGAKFQLASISLRAEYEMFDLDDVEDLSMVSVGATITF